MDKNIISLEIGGKTVNSEFFLFKPSELGIKLVEPDFDVVAYSGHIMGILTDQRRYIENGSLTDLGEQTAKKIIFDLYESYIFIQENEELVKKSIESIKREIEVSQNEFAKYLKNSKTNREELKRLLTAGEINNHKYQMEIAAYKKEEESHKKEYDENYRITINTIARGCLGFFVQDYVIEYVKVKVKDLEIK